MLLRLCLLAVLVSLGVLSSACTRHDVINIYLNNGTGRDLQVEVDGPSHSREVYTVGPGEVGTVGKGLGINYPGKLGEVISFRARTTSGAVAAGTGSCIATYVIMGKNGSYGQVDFILSGGNITVVCTETPERPWQ